MPRRPAETGYSALAMARHLIFERAEATRMAGDGRMSPEGAELVADAIDDAIEEIFVTYLQFREEKMKRPHPREKWDRTKWERKVVCGRGELKESSRTRYLTRAGLEEGGPWDRENYGKAA